MDKLPVRKTENLRIGRVSLTGARYFVTFCTLGRKAVLMDSATRNRIFETCASMQADGDLSTLAAVVMPDHAHVLFTLGERLLLRQMMGKFKTLSRAGGLAEWRWQTNGFEHRLRPDENPADYAFYMFMNPYRAGLIAMDRAWPGWFCPEPTRLGFLQHLDPDGAPPAEWLDTCRQVAGRIVVNTPDRV